MKKGKDLIVNDNILLHQNGSRQLHPLRGAWTQWITKVYRVVSIEPIHVPPLGLATPGVKRFTLASRDNEIVTYDIRDEEDVDI